MILEEGYCFLTWVVAWCSCHYSASCPWKSGDRASDWSGHAVSDQQLRREEEEEESTKAMEMNCLLALALSNENQSVPAGVLPSRLFGHCWKKQPLFPMHHLFLLC